MHILNSSASIQFVSAVYSHFASIRGPMSRSAARDKSSNGTGVNAESQNPKVPSKPTRRDSNVGAANASIHIAKNRPHFMTRFQSAMTSTAMDQAAKSPARNTVYRSPWSPGAKLTRQ